MLTYYATEREAHVGSKPKGVLEVLAVREWDGRTPLKRHLNGFEFDTLLNRTYQCSADAPEEREMWMKAIESSLLELDRIVQEENEEAESELQQDSERELNTVKKAAETVRQAKEEGEKLALAKRNFDECCLKYEMAQKKSDAATMAFESCQERVNSSVCAVESATEEEQRAKKAIKSVKTEFLVGKAEIEYQSATERLNISQAQCEVDQNELEAIREDYDHLTANAISWREKRDVAAKELKIRQEIAENMRKEASEIIQKAHDAKTRSKLNADKRSLKKSHVDPLVEGYLLFKTSKMSMTRKFFVLFGKTLSYYTDADAYKTNPALPSGLFHITGSGDWTGKVGLKTLPNAFEISTLEGKSLLCSAPVNQDVIRWTTAIQIGMTMAPMSPGRASIARRRKMSFMSPPASPKSIPEIRHVDQQPVALPPVVEEHEEKKMSSSDTIQGYLVKKGHFVPRMKKKYCVLHGIELKFYDSHTDYETDRVHSCIGSVQVSNVSEWDGHTSLLHYKNGFEIDTVQHQRVWCSAANVKEQERWMAGLRAAIAKHRVVSQSIQVTDEFRQRLIDYFEKYNPSKATDVNVLLELYENREMDLLEHLDSTYDTNLSKEDGMDQMVQKHQRQKTWKPPIIEGELKRQDPVFHRMKDVYGVLIANKMHLYDSKAQSEMDTPLKSFLVVHYEEWDGHSTLHHTVPHGIKLFSDAGDTFLCTAPTDLERQKWLIGLGRGLGYARAAGKGTETTSELKELLQEYYRQHNESKTGEIETLLTYFRGNELEMLHSLDKTYGTNLSQDERALQILAKLKPTEIQPPLDDRIQMQGYLHKKSTILAPLSRSYCVLNDTTLNFYNSHDLANKVDAIPASLDVMTGITDWNGGNHLSHVLFGFRFETEKSGTIYCQVSSEEEKSEWMAKARSALAKGEQGIEETPLKTLLVAYMEKHNPSKVVEVPSLLRAYEGREEALLTRLDDIYLTEIAQDPIYTSAVTVPEVHATTTEKELLMEGYLLKRGHLMPSMRKRYCCLEKNRLSIFDTHEDAKGDQVPHGTVTIVSVCDWEGRTAGHHYSNGFEFDTDDHKTYFCSAYSNEEKKAWMSAIRTGIATSRVVKHQDEFHDQEERSMEDTLRSILVSFYQQHNPKKQSDIDALLDYYRCHEKEMFVALDKNYGTNLTETPAVVEILQRIKPPVGQEAEEHCEGYLLRRLGGLLSLQRVYGALDGVMLKFHSTREGHKAGILQPQDIVTILNVSEWDGRYGMNKTSPYGIQIGCLDKSDQHSQLFLSAESEYDKKRWMKSIQLVLDQKQAELMLAEEMNQPENTMQPRHAISAYLQSRDGTLPTMSESYFVWEPPMLYTYTNETRQKLLSQVTVTSIAPWNGQGVLHKCRFPFSIVTTSANHQASTVLYLNAANETDLTAWTSKLKRGLEETRAEELLLEQKRSLDVVPDLDRPSYDFEGYMMTKTSGISDLFGMKEMYCIVSGVRFQAFTSKKMTDQPNIDVEVENIYEWTPSGNEVHSSGFQLQTKTNQSVFCRVSSKSSKTEWIAAITRGVNLKRGQNLLKDEKLEMKTISTPTPTPSSPLPVVETIIPHASMESELECKIGTLGMMKEYYFALVGSILQRYSSKAAARAGAEYLDQLTILSASDWRGKKHGFQLSFQNVKEHWYFNAFTSEKKELWTRSIRTALDFTLAEQFLSDSRAPTTADGIPSELEGYVRIKHGHLTPLKERYCTLKGAWFSIWTSKEQINDTSAPISTFEVVGAMDWFGDAVKFGICIESLEHGTFECSFTTAMIKKNWMQALELAIQTIDQEELVSRDVEMAEMPGASMEGYLRKKGVKFKAFKNRYCVLVGLELVYYETQTAAVSGQAMPLGVFEVTNVKDWNTKHSDLFDALQHRLTEHGFIISTTTERELQCCAANAAEKQFWMKAIRKELETASSSEIEIRSAMLAAQEKERALKVVKNRYAAVKAENDRENSAISNLLNDDDWDDEEDEDENRATDYIDKDPEMSPVRNAQTKSFVRTEQRGVNNISPDPIIPFWKTMCVCWNRPSSSSSMIEPLLTEEQKQLYSCDFYESGTSDNEL